MEKLIMLIDIYEEEVVWVHSVWDKITDKEAARIISKQFWFIERLVDNDKIDKRKVFDGEMKTCWELVEKDIDDFLDEVNLRERLLMLLAISENPIEDLISYLK